MPHSEAFCLQHSDLNGFLQAHIGTERHGGSLSVLSAIARLGEDPWNEAERLAILTGFKDQPPPPGAAEPGWPLQAG